MLQLMRNQLSQDENYHELLDETGRTRAHWQPFIDSLSNEQPEQLRKRMESVQRQIQDNGVTYNVYADTHGLQRPWDLDALPLIMPQDEWQHIAAAVAQRATLLNQILLDVYGEQALLKSGQLPPALVYGHDGFLRDCVGMQHDDDVALHSYAVDIARAPNGQWWVVSDRTQAPTGAGYALENRTIIANAFPKMFRQLNVERLSSFFVSMRDSLAHWGRRVASRQSKAVPDITPLNPAESPLVVILTPGPYNETYHEQSFLAGYLGYPLVQGNDLTVRNGVVWLKTIAGLKPVHAILRRIDDDYCDPLELNAASLLGVPGLAEVARRGHVAIANALGSNLLQSGALLGFLPTLCESVLGEELRMPSVATWWCGEPAAMAYVTEHLDELVIKPAYPQMQTPPVFGEDLDDKQKIALIQQLKANPSHYIAQEQVAISQAPTLIPHDSMGKPSASIQSRAVSLRVYAFASPNGYAIMPGGLARVASAQDGRVVTMQRGGTSKDIWVRSPYDQPTFSLLNKINSSQDLVRENTLLSSRMAENLFWYGRYSVRNLQKSMMLRMTIQSLMEYAEDEREGEWPTIQGLCHWFQLIPRPTAKNAADRMQNPPDLLSDEALEPLLIKAVFSADVASLASGIQQHYQQAFNLRERISTNHWQTVNALLTQFTQQPQLNDMQEVLLQLDIAIQHFVAISGYAMDWMTRDLGWRFMSLGRRMERLQFMTQLLSRALKMPSDSNLDWVLDISNNLVTYRARYAAKPEWMPILDLLLLDEQNPNSVVFQLKGLVTYLEKMQAQDGEGYLAEPLRQCWEQLVSIDIDQHYHPGNSTLIACLEAMYQTTLRVSDRLNLRFFSYTSAYSTAGY